MAAAGIAIKPYFEGHRFVSIAVGALARDHAVRKGRVEIAVGRPGRIPSIRPLHRGHFAGVVQTAQHMAGRKRAIFWQGFERFGSHKVIFVLELCASWPKLD